MPDIVVFTLVAGALLGMIRWMWTAPVGRGELDGYE